MEGGKWRMRSGEWEMEGGKWRMGNGEWEMENGKRRMSGGKWLMENRERRIGNRESGIGNGDLHIRKSYLESRWTTRVKEQESIQFEPFNPLRVVVSYAYLVFSQPPACLHQAM